MTIHPTAIVSEHAQVHSSVEIGPFTIVHDNAVIAEGTTIGSNCEIGVPASLGDGSPLRIGANSVIRSHSVFYESSSFGERLVTGHRVTVRELTHAGDGFQIGTLSDIQGHCKIGEYVRFHSNVHVGQHTTIEDYVWVFPYVVFTNDPHPPSEVMQGVRVKSFAAIATMSTILPGVTIGEGALVGACSSVVKDVGDHRIAVGNPARDKGETSAIKLKDGSDRPAYPWKHHFHRGYPENIVAQWLSSVQQYED
ncbi:acyltransferase [Ruegeria arenilitoris]|uniref:acyltransferase n=1 Tax=Ruegeria arenilitoris TaxID=1173585 RepID=UPI00147BA7EB|nr:acyltransferase [Ruegeria arenilitoris]